MADEHGLPQPGTTIHRVQANFNQLINQLISLLNVAAERLNLLGGIYKRKAMLLNRKIERETAYIPAASCYEEAAQIVGKSNSAYSTVNAIARGCILDCSGALPRDEFKVAGKTYKLITR